MADIDIVQNNTYEYILEQELLGQKIINRFTYVYLAAPTLAAPAFNLMSAWWVIMKPLLQAVQSVDLSYTRILFRHLGGTEGTHELLISETGGVTPVEGTAPSNVCATMRLYTTEGISRSGWKRFAGVIKDHIVGNVYDPTQAPDIESDFAALANQLQGAFTAYTGVVFDSAVWAKVPPPGTGYAGFLVDTCSMPRLGTQNSRKPNYGD